MREKEKQGEQTKEEREKVLQNAASERKQGWVC